MQISQKSQLFNLKPLKGFVYDGKVQDPFSPNRKEETKSPAGDTTKLSPEARMKQADAKREEAWKRFNQPGVIYRAMPGKDRGKMIRKFQELAREAAEKAGKKGSRAYRDAYRRSFVNGVTTHVGSSGDHYSVSKDQSARKHVLKYGSRFQDADGAYQGAQWRIEDKKRSQAQQKTLLDGLLKNFHPGHGTGL